LIADVPFFIQLELQLPDLLWEANSCIHLHYRIERGKKISFYSICVMLCELCDKSACSTLLFWTMLYRIYWKPQTNTPQCKQPTGPRFYLIIENNSNSFQKHVSHIWTQMRFWKLTWFAKAIIVNMSWP